MHRTVGMLCLRTSARLSDSLAEPGAGLAGFESAVRARVAFQSGSGTWALTPSKLPKGDRVSPSTRSRRASAGRPAPVSIPTAAAAG